MGILKTLEKGKSMSQEAELNLQYNRKSDQSTDLAVLTLFS